MNYFLGIQLQLSAHSISLEQDIKDTLNVLIFSVYSIRCTVASSLIPVYLPAVC